MLLWGEKARGSVTELAELADVAFAGAHAELRAMQRAQLVRSEFDGRKEVFEANFEHPEADALRTLVVASTSPTPLTPPAQDETVKRGLVSLGAPLRGIARLDVPESERASVLVKGASVARRDPTVARCLPLCFWRMRDELNIKELASLANHPEEKHAVGFFLELTGAMGGDRRLVGLAESLRDGRMTSVRDFFQTGARERLVRDFPLAKKWGFQMNMDLEAFRGLFEKFVNARAGTRTRASSDCDATTARDQT